MATPHRRLCECLVERDLPGAGGDWLRSSVKLRGERGGPRWSAGSGWSRSGWWRWPRRAPLAPALAGCGGSGGNPAAGAGGFRRQGLYFQCVHFAQRAGAQHRCPAQGKRRWLRGARWPVASCFLRPCPHGRGPAQARHGTGRHGECRQRRQDVHHDCRAEVAGPAPSQHRQPDLAVPAPGLGQGPGHRHHHLPRTADPPGGIPPRQRPGLRDRQRGEGTNQAGHPADRQASGGL